MTRPPSTSSTGCACTAWRGRCAPAWRPRPVHRRRVAAAGRSSTTRTDHHRQVRQEIRRVARVTMRSGCSGNCAWPRLTAATCGNWRRSQALIIIVASWTHSLAAGPAGMLEDATVTPPLRCRASWHEVIGEPSSVIGARLPPHQSGRRFGAQAICRAPAGIQPSGWQLICHRGGPGCQSSERTVGRRGMRPPPWPSGAAWPSRPRGVRVGLSAALRGPCEPVGVLQGTPGNPHSATSTPFSQRRWSRAVRRSGVRMDCNPRQPACSRRVAVPSRLSLPGADHRSRQQRQHAYHRTHDLGHSGPFTVVKRRRLAASGPRGVRVGRAAALRGPCKPAGYPEAPPEIRIVPVNVARQRRSHRHTRHRWPPRDSPRLLPNLEQQSAPALRRRRRTLRHITRRLRRSKHRRCSFLSQGGVPGTPNRPPRDNLAGMGGFHRNTQPLTTRRRLGLINISTAPRHPVG